MNINDLHGLPEPLEIAEASPVSAVQQQSPVLSPNASGEIQDRTEVSTAANLALHAMSVPDVRMDKVAEVQQAIANGTYQVSPQDVADKLVRQMMGE